MVGEGGRPAGGRRHVRKKPRGAEGNVRGLWRDGRRASVRKTAMVGEGGRPAGGRRQVRKNLREAEGRCRASEVEVWVRERRRGPGVMERGGK